MIQTFWRLKKFEVKSMARPCDNREAKRTVLEELRRRVSAVKLQNFFRRLLARRRKSGTTKKVDKRFYLNEMKIRKL